MPLYLSLSNYQFQKRIKKLYQILEKCCLCPRRCGVNRLAGEKGFCRVGSLPIVSAYHPHFGEESVLVGSGGSGTIFFTFCNLACVFCQNYEISQLGVGEEISEEKLAQIMMELQKLGCENINLVSPTHQVPFIVKAIYLAKKEGLDIPIVYNTNSYESLETLRLLKDLVDIYLPDFKYSDDEVAQRYSKAPGYFKIAKDSIFEMYKQVGDLKIKDGVAQKGVLVRHLVLPNDLAKTEKIMKALFSISKNIWVNLMDQYRPSYKAFNYKQLFRPITETEYKRAVKVAKKAGIRNIIID